MSATLVVSLTIPGTPISQGSMKAFNVNGRARVVHANPAKLRSWRGDVIDAARGKFDAIPRGPVIVRATFFVARPKNHYGSGRNADTVKPSAPMFPSTKPDLDKFARALLDALTIGGAFADDAQVIELVVGKRYGQPRTEVGIEVIG